MNVDKKIIDMISNVSNEERNALMDLWDMKNKNPEMKLILAIFRDVYMFKSMTQSHLLRYESKIDELEKRIEELELLRQKELR